MRMHELGYVSGFLHVYVGLILRTHRDFRKTKQDKFSAFMLRFEMNSTSPGDSSEPLFSHYKKPYMVYFQKIQKFNEKTLRFTRNSESKGSFSQNTLKTYFI